jgi:archaetidylinositol phosphate synthase
MPRVNPNMISWAALIAAGLAAVCVFLGGTVLLLLSILLVLASSYLDALDGRVAKMYQKASPQGDFIDHVFDRYADLFLLVGVALSRYCSLLVGLFAIVGVLMTSYMGTQAQAVGQGRRYAGVLGRADRLVLLFLGILLQLLVSPAGAVVWGLGPVVFQPLEWIMVLFAVLGNATAIQRALGIWRGFGR